MLYFFEKTSRTNENTHLQVKSTVEKNFNYNKPLDKLTS
jgi:hypothetical protein